MKRSPQICLLLLSMVLSFAVPAQPKVVGYLPIYGIQSPDLRKIPFEKLTHLNLAFIRVDSTGALKAPVWMDSIIQAAHANKVKVLGSIGGGNAPAYYAQLLKDDRRAAFVNSLFNFVMDHQLDGIDVDLEGSLIDDHYETFLADLSQKFKARKKLLTAAIATWVAPKISNGALAYMDLVNIMSYDKTGPWTPGRPGPHAPLTMAADDLQYWRTRGIARKKLILGLPFYGYRFSKELINGMGFGEIITKFPGSAQQDSLLLNDGVSIYYNGTETIRTKTKLAMEKAGGVMIWQLLQDAPAPDALIDVIDETIHGKRKNRE